MTEAIATVVSVYICVETFGAPDSPAVLLIAGAGLAMTAGPAPAMLALSALSALSAMSAMSAANAIHTYMGG